MLLYSRVAKLAYRTSSSRSDLGLNCGDKLSSWSQARRAGGADDRKREMMEQMEEQRAFYMWAEPRGGANPDRAGLNPKRQRTGT
jgi:hypothetical protein